MHDLDAGSQPVEQERLGAGKADREEQPDAIRVRPGHLASRHRPQRHEPVLPRRADQQSFAGSRHQL